MEEYDIPLVLKAAFGWTGITDEMSSLIDGTVMAQRYDEVNSENIVANFIIIYSSIEIAIGAIQLLKVLFLLCRCYLRVSWNNVSVA